MSDFDAYKDDVERVSSPSDHEIDRLVTGRALGADGALDEIAAFLEDVRPYFQERPDDATAAQHLAAIAQASGALHDDASVAVRGSSADRARSQGARSRSRSKPRRRKLLVLAATLGVLLAFGGAAYAGALPGPMQGAVSDLVGNVGVSVPGDGDSDGGDSDDGDQGGSDDGHVGNLDDRDPGDVDRGEQRVDEGPADERDDDQRDEAGDGAGDNADEGNSNDDDQGEQEDGDEGQQGGQDDADQDDQDGNGPGGKDDGNRARGDDDEEESRQSESDRAQPPSAGRSESAPRPATEVQGCPVEGATARLSRGGRSECR